MEFSIEVPDKLPSDLLQVVNHLRMFEQNEMFVQIYHSLNIEGKNPLMIRKRAHLSQKKLELSFITNVLQNSI